MSSLNFGENLRRLRKSKDLSQEQLAEMLNISRQAVSKWESGKAYPDIENLVLLRSIFNITLDDLILDENIEKEEVISDGFEASDNMNNKDDEDDDLWSNLMIGGLIIGIAAGFITDDFMWGAFGGIAGMGLGYVIEGIMKIIKK